MEPTPSWTILAGKVVQAYQLVNGGAPDLLGEASTTKRPVELYVNGSRVHVNEVGLFKWLLCLSGIRCGFGNTVEVFNLGEANESLTGMGSYTGVWARVPYSQVAGGHVVVPKVGGLKVYRAVAQ